MIRSWFAKSILLIPGSFILSNLVLLEGSWASDLPALTYEKVMAKGQGASFDEALQNALALAIAQVNGVSVTKNVDIQKAVGSYHSASEATETDTAAGIARQQTVAVGGVAVQTPDGKTDSVAAVSASDSVSEFEAVSAGTAKVVQDGNFEADRKVVSSSAQTAGTINRFQVLDSAQSAGNWDVSVLAEVGMYRASAASKRLKIAVLPFRIESGEQTAAEFEDGFRGEIINKLTQSNKFAVLDRDFGTDTAAELASLKDPDIKKDQIARIGNKLGADYILVGVIKRAETRTESHYLSSINKNVYGKTSFNADIVYRLIEVATGVTEFSDTVATENSLFGSAEQVEKEFSDKISSSIIDSLYPVKIEKISGSTLYLGQGGDTIFQGEHFKLIGLGDPIVDSYTGETLGREESDLGEIEVFEVLSRYSKARLLAGTTISSLAGFKSVIVRKEASIATKNEEIKIRVKKNPPSKRAVNNKRDDKKPKSDDW